MTAAAVALSTVSSSTTVEHPLIAGYVIYFITLFAASGGFDCGDGLDSGPGYRSLSVNGKVRGGTREAAESRAGLLVKHD